MSWGTAADAWALRPLDPAGQRQDDLVMPDLHDERPAAPDPTVPDAPSHQPVAVVVVRPTPIAARSRWSQRVATAAARLPELARNPAVLATAAVTASVAGEAAVGLLRRAFGGPVAAGSTMHINGVVVHRVHVVHHHVVHLAEPRAAWPT